MPEIDRAARRFPVPPAPSAVTTWKKLKPKTEKRCVFAAEKAVKAVCADAFFHAFFPFGLDKNSYRRYND
ncbi:MAG TPA: hypothetical protein H9726_02865 [Candidatus Borkfalkia avicola]|uniref:Uncharacterized protein n=1 Tax=Candidatus Borkfalkia avicola TaxID=2838503 RepID=A0A9D2D6M7_9FIRM|nr:hypothetical protein [Candidatus Borkfalkia avicola]